jgi:hypothetical protein
MTQKKAVCKLHPDNELVCLKCMTAKGGRTTAEKHGDKLSEWGRRGGRPKKPRK